MVLGVDKTPFIVYNKDTKNERRKENEKDSWQRSLRNFVAQPKKQGK